jgi:hypothetical protein
MIVKLIFDEATGDATPANPTSCNTPTPIQGEPNTISIPVPNDLNPVTASHTRFTAELAETSGSTISIPMPNDLNPVPVSHTTFTAELAETSGSFGKPLLDTSGLFGELRLDISGSLDEPLSPDLDPEWLINLSKDANFYAPLAGDASANSSIALPPSAFELSPISNFIPPSLVTHSTPIPDATFNAPVVTHLAVPGPFGGPFQNQTNTNPDPCPDNRFVAPFGNAFTSAVSPLIASADVSLPTLPLTSESVNTSRRSARTITPTEKGKANKENGGVQNGQKRRLEEQVTGKARRGKVGRGNKRAKQACGASAVGPSGK